MRSYYLIIFILLFFSTLRSQKKTDSLYLQGDLGMWMHLNKQDDYSLGVGGRYVPSINYGINYSQKHNLHFEAAADLFGNISTIDFSDYNTLGHANLYRLNAEYSTEKIAINIGLQQIQFGAATMLRPLMWFDLLDPRDPMQISDGVYAVHGNHQFTDKVSASLWVLYGNSELRGWDWAQSKSTIPEIGGRVTYSVPRGKLGFNYHYRKANFIQEVDTVILPDQKIGFDIKLNYTFGVWLEASWNRISNNGLYLFSNQSLATIGVDRNINIGKGLYFAYEHMLVSYHGLFFGLNNVSNISALQVSYPFSDSDKVKSIIYYDWDYRRAYSIIDFQHKFKHITAHILAYSNAEYSRIPNMKNLESLYTGNGIQFMLVFKH